MGACQATARQPHARGSRARHCAARDNLQDYTIEYLTDVEGNWEYFCQFVSKSLVLSWEDEVQGPFGMGKLQLQPKGILVFGGDAPDKGPGDVRFVRTLLDLQSRHPNQVEIILGNRDLNKLRFWAELEPGAEPFNIPWDKNAKPLQTWLKEQHPQLQDTPVNRLRWMLHFAGCQRTTFKTRRQELAMLSSKHSATDEDVLDSFRSAVDPNGKDPWMLRLLQVGKLASIVGDTLFVHGGLHDEVLEQVPGKGKLKGTVDDWVKQLNAWKDDQLAEYIKHPLWYMDGKGQRRRGAEELILYGTPGYPGNATVVYYNPFQDGNPQQLSITVEAYLEKNQITRLLSGHQPHGQSPTVVRHPRTDILAVTCDTSYSNPDADKLFNEANNRGVVVSVVRLKGPLLEIDGVLADGTKHGCKIYTDPKLCQMPDALVGRQQLDGSWIKTVLEDNSRTLVQAVIGNGPPRFDLITNKFPWEKARFNLKDHFSTDSLSAKWDPLQDLNPEHLQPCSTISHLSRNYAAYSTEAELADLRRQRPALSIKNNLGYNKAEFLEAKTYICSWLGVVAQITAPEKNAQVTDNINELLSLKKRVIFVSNNSHWSRAEFAKEVVKAGINMNEAEATKHVLNSAFTCAWFLMKKERQKPFVICSEPGILEELRELGVKNYVATITDDGKEKPEYMKKATPQDIQDCVKENPDVDCVVLGWDFGLNVFKAAVASAYIRWNQERRDGGGFGRITSASSWTPALAGPDSTGSGKRFSLSEEKSLPSSEQDQKNQFIVVKCSSDYHGLLGVTPEEYLPQKGFNNRTIMIAGNGRMADLLAFDTAFDVGKPSELMLEALRRPEAEHGYGVDLNSAVVIGDELKTDIKLAHRGGMKSLLVLSGRTTADILDEKAEGEVVPTWVIDSLAEVLDGEKQS